MQLDDTRHRLQKSVATNRARIKLGNKASLEKIVFCSCFVTGTPYYCFMEMGWFIALFKSIFSVMVVQYFDLNHSMFKKSLVFSAH